MPSELSHWLECPSCRYKVTLLVRAQLKHDHDCPRCKSHKLSEFEVMEAPDAE